MYIYICMYMYTYMCMCSSSIRHVHICIHVCIHACICIHSYSQMPYTHIHMPTYILTYMNECISTFTYICVRTCICIYIYIYIYVGQKLSMLFVQVEVYTYYTSICLAAEIPISHVKSTPDLLHWQPGLEAVLRGSAIPSGGLPATGSTSRKPGSPKTTGHVSLKTPIIP